MNSMQTIDKRAAFPRWVVRCGLKATEYETLDTLMTMADKDWVFRGSQVNVAEASGLGAKTVWKAIDTLKAIGAVVLLSKGNKRTEAQIVWDDPNG